MAIVKTIKKKKTKNSENKSTGEDVKKWEYNAKWYTFCVKQYGSSPESETQTFHMI